MKRLMALFFFLILLIHCEAQEDKSLPSAAPSSADTLGKQGSKTLSRYQLKKPVYHVSVGMEFSTASGYGSGFTEYVVPTVSYPVGKRFLISGGVMIANTNYFNARPLYSGDIFQPYNGNYTSLTVFAEGTYFINDRLTISGSFYKEFPVTGKSLSYSPYNPISQQGSQGFNVNVQYKVGKHMFFQAGFQMNQGINPYNINPYAPYHAHGFSDLNLQGVPQTLFNIFSGQ
ncbi:MAG: hypothetical protein NTU51_01940 [Bacteroidetes bacterium]|nr:hypothetical protein [Bacteroidota bacterium]